ncbi:hypothetical protein P154DRAFT_531827 [Amniculicola lignicola CBS 123094]|uniref:Uncharacterized protein n=1 Tax=Amniculicola lignicola CBS 123094 TaxID=1392246 RepID=A0A6A5X1J9_9PLEO|nr:hypothetical protein P154DRAFT_531827 [Amniculicola lignicola CBS 123094]
MTIRSSLSSSSPSSSTSSFLSTSSTSSTSTPETLPSGSTTSTAGAIETATDNPQSSITSSTTSRTTSVISSSGLVDIFASTDGFITTPGSTNASTSATEVFSSSISTNPASTSDGLPILITPTETPSTSGSIPLPPAITTPPIVSSLRVTTETERQATASDASVAFGGQFPPMQNWFDHPEGPQITGSIDNLFGGIALPKASGLLASLVKCAIDTSNKIRSGVLKGSIDAVKGLRTDLKPIIDAFNEIKPEDTEPEPEPEPSDPKSDQPSSTQPEPSLSSSPSCTVNTVSNCKIQCTAIATTTIGGAKRRADDGTCITACEAPITKCGASGVTSTSTITSTTTTMTQPICAIDCSSCNSPGPPQDDPNLGGDYLTAANGLPYVPAPTISVLPADGNIVARNIKPQDNITASHNLHRRAFTRPGDGVWLDDVESWMLTMMKYLGSHRLEHDVAAKGETTTVITDKLEGESRSWRVGNLYGCTVVIVLSRKRIWMAHIWEKPTMMNVKEDFERDALHILSIPEGDYLGVKEGLGKFTGNGGDFENTDENHVRNYICGNADIYGYIKPWPDPNCLSGRGKVFLQYDPVVAQLAVPDVKCTRQVAGLELWFESGQNKPFKRDSWHALPNQVVFEEPGPSRRLIRGQEVTEANENEWQEHVDLLKREGGVCPLPSGTPSASSASQDPTTFRTSIVPSSVDNPPTTTKKPQPSSEVPKSTPSPTPTPAPPSPKTKALSTILRTTYDSDYDVI